MPSIFISYRRDDAGFAADRVRDAALEYVANPDDVFMDTSSIPPGVVFSEYIQERVEQCDVLLALIGANWLGATDTSSGKRRLEDPNDYVHREIVGAMARGIPVVPILLGDVDIPSPSDLPGPLQPLTERNAWRVGRTSFSNDMTELMGQLGFGRQRKTVSPSSSWRIVLGGLALVLVSVIATIIVMQASNSDSVTSVQARHDALRSALAVARDDVMANEMLDETQDCAFGPAGCRDGPIFASCGAYGGSLTIARMQERLKICPDGVYGHDTQSTVEEFMSQHLNIASCLRVARLLPNLPYSFEPVSLRGRESAINDLAAFVYLVREPVFEDQLAMFCAE
ncbi:MAG: toll/interleukin-1 receptor domain-containing protein [Pseudomonadota bacterium]